MIYVGIYLLIINLIAVILCLADKRRAKLKLRRIRERTLLLISALGGSVGMFFAMQVSRHKTKHLQFMVGIPLIFIIQVILMGLILQFVEFG